MTHPIAPIIIQAEATEQDLIDAAAAAVKQSNWVIGEAASKWTGRYSAGRTDADFAELIGSTQSGVNYARRVYDRFYDHGHKHDFAWRHWRTMLTWNDADECLAWAESTFATFREMEAWRNIRHGKPAVPEPVATPPRPANIPQQPLARPIEDNEVTGEGPIRESPPLTEEAEATPTEGNPEEPPSPVHSSGPHVANNSGEFEWYTPAEIVDAARQVMGCIDLDPASCETANRVVEATEFYGKEQDGLTQEWAGRVWLNPPYATGLVGEFIQKLIGELDAGRVTEACVLVNNATETRWFQSLASHCDSICFPKKRIKFWNPGRDLATGLQGQAVLYFGVHTEKFRELFGSQGVTVAR